MKKDEAMKRLHEVLKPNDTIYTIVRHVSRGNMSRRISLIALVYDEHCKKVRPFQLDGLVEAIGIAKRKTVTRYGGSGQSWKSYEEGLVMSGAGMDMGFELVYRLGQAMWPNGTPEPHGTRNGQPDSDGGYALEHKWL
jgi:hypothetical protein